MRKCILLAIIICVSVGCAKRLVKEKEVIKEETIEFHGVTCTPTLKGNDLLLKFEHSYSADAEIVRQYRRNVFCYLDLAASIATLGSVDLSNSRESDAVGRKTFRKPLENGTPLTGYLRITDPTTDQKLFSRTIAYNLIDSRVQIPLLALEPVCVDLVLQGEIRTFDRNVPINMDASICP